MTISATTQGLRMGVATSSSRPTVPFDGQVISETDTDSLKVYNGSAWVTPPSGLVCVKAETTFTAVTTIVVDNVFTSSYTNYLIKIRHFSTGSDFRYRMRVGGVAATGANYNNQNLYAQNTTVAAVQETNQTSNYIVNTSTGNYGSSAEINFYSPALAAPTSATCFDNNMRSSFTGIILSVYGTNHTLSTAYDGVEFNLASGVTSGTYSVYGYSKVV